MITVIFLLQFVTDPNDVNDASSTLGIKIGDVRHSDEVRCIFVTV